jgi:Ca-activated chloride channel family protein
MTTSPAGGKRPSKALPARIVLFFCVAALLVAGMRALPQDSGTPRFSINSNLVRLLVTVRDHATNAIVTGLNKNDFAVADENIPQSIAVFERNTSVPLSIALLIDTSASTRKDLNYEISSIVKFLRALKQAGNPDDALALYSFNWQIRMEAGFTRSEQRAEHALKLLRCEGGTSLYDAVYLVSQDISDREGRHVVIVVTDGGDTTSYKSFSDAVKAALRSEAILYPIVVIPIENDAGRNTGGEHALDTMAQTTGGRPFYPAGAGALDRAFLDILQELRTQYLLGYYPRNVTVGSERYHRVTVSTKETNLRAVTRTGYYEP